MRIDAGNLIPLHIARAYGVAAPRTATLPAQVTPPTPPTAPQPLASIGPGASPPAHSLIAGHVQGPVQFDGVSVPTPRADTFSLYTRAADKIEAATAVQIGRTIDIKG